MNNITDFWSPKEYKENHSFVFKSGESLVNLLKPKKGEKILDVGCGTGELTNILSSSKAILHGIDSSSNMIQEAKENYRDITFTCSDICSFDTQSKFDAVFSNAALHWIKSPSIAIQKISDSLKPKGRFVAEMGGKNNVNIIIKAVEETLLEMGLKDINKLNPWYFPSVSEYTLMLENYNFDINYICYYDRLTPLEEDGIRKWLKAFGQPFFQGLTFTDIQYVITSVENKIRDILYIDGRWYADYKRLCFACTKKA